MNTPPPDDYIAPPPSISLVDEAPPTPPEDRAAAFHQVFSWHGREIRFSIASELYYRELRVHANAPALGDYATLGDFAAEAPRVLYCASHDAAALRRLRLLPVEEQLARLDEWTEQNIALHELAAAASTADAILKAVNALRFTTTDTSNLDGTGN